MSDKEFHALFRRESHTINMKGCSGKDDLDDKIKAKRDAYKERKKQLRERGVYSKRLNFLLVQQKKLLDHGFSDRSFNEAIANPRGREALTFKYGTKKAEDIMLHRKQARRRMERQRFRNRRELR